MFEIINLHKSFGREKVLKGINLHLEENKIYGLLGRNGVGKTTLLNLISGQISRNKGEIRLDEEEVFENSRAISDICLIKENGLGIDEIKVKLIFDAAAILYKNWDEEYKNKLVKEFNLNVKKKFNKLSRGNQTIVGLIMGLASRARITIFDEPSLGLDAAYRDKFYKYLLDDWEKNPRTVIIATHLIDEVTNLFEEVIILKNGKVFLQEGVDSLIERAYYLDGKETDILSTINDKNIIYKEGFGNKSIIGFFGGLSTEEKQKLKQNNIEISHIPLQKLFIYLTEMERKEAI